MKNQDVIDRILAYHPALESEEGCDGYKAGNPGEECRGVAAALVPTAEVIRRAASLGCNLLITHEPIFYQTPDFPQWKGSFPNQVYEQKRSLLERCGMTVWRDHDHMHAHRPDSIFSGVIRELGWEAYYRQPEGDTWDMSFRFELPPVTVGELGAFLKEKMGLNGLRYLGRPKDVVTRVAMVGHLCPGCFFPEGIGADGFYHDYAMDVIRMMEEEVEVIIPGEIIEWTALAYIRDALAMGKKKACLNVGHFNLEELGMADFAKTLRQLTKGELPVHYIPTGDSFSYLT